MAYHHFREQYFREQYFREQYYMDEYCTQGADWQSLILGNSIIQMSIVGRSITERDIIWRSITGRDIIWSSITGRGIIWRSIVGRVLWGLVLQGGVLQRSSRLATSSHACALFVAASLALDAPNYTPKVQQKQCLTPIILPQTKCIFLALPHMGQLLQSPALHCITLDVLDTCVSLVVGPGCRLHRG